MPSRSHHVEHQPAQEYGDWLLVLLSVLVPLITYAAAVVWQHRRQKAWSVWRTLAFALGTGLITLGLSPPAAQLAHNDLRGHMIQHLLISMYGPLFLVLAAPVTLLLRSVPPRIGRCVPEVLRSRPLHLLSHPITAMSLNIGGMYLLYLTPLFAWSLDTSPRHLLVNVHFFAAGYLFAWSIAGPDPAPHRPGMPTRIAVLMSAIALHVFLAKLMYGHGWPRGTGFDAEQVREAAVVMYYGGDLAEMLLALALFSTWYQHRRRRRRRTRHPRRVNAGSPASLPERAGVSRA